MFYKDNQLFTESEIKALNPNTSFPTPFKADGYEVVFDVPSPIVGELQVAYQDGTRLTLKATELSSGALEIYLKTRLKRLRLSKKLST